jgi:hypothetical protein
VVVAEEPSTIGFVARREEADASRVRRAVSSRGSRRGGRGPEEEEGRLFLPRRRVVACFFQWSSRQRETSPPHNPGDGTNPDLL